MSKRTCIGLTGRMGSGKGEVVKVLEARGFKYISLSDIVREEIAKIGRDVSRAESQDIGNRLRKEGGAGVLGKRVREKIEASDIEKWAVDGVRNPHEVDELKKLETFYLLGIDLNLDTLLSRIKSRKRSFDNADVDELKRRLDREWGIGEPEDGQQVGKCMALTDFTIDNNGSLEDLEKNIQTVLEKVPGAVS
ncbi:MAG: AAA family ATPase [bacterium]|nr:AAA family ATPase [bacterium]